MKLSIFACFVALTSSFSNAEPLKEIKRVEGEFQFTEVVRGKDALGLVNVSQLQVERFETVQGQPVEGQDGIFWHSIRMKIRYSLLGCFNSPAPVFASARMKDGRLMISLAPQFLFDLRSVESQCEVFPSNSVLLDLGEFKMTEKEALDLVFFAKYTLVNMDPSKVMP
jgi:hypothetical protein